MRSHLCHRCRWALRTEHSPPLPAWGERAVWGRNQSTTVTTFTRKHHHQLGTPIEARTCGRYGERQFPLPRTVCVLEESGHSDLHESVQREPGEHSQFYRNQDSHLGPPKKGGSHGAGQTQLPGPGRACGHPPAEDTEGSGSPDEPTLLRLGTGALPLARQGRSSQHLPVVSGLESRAQEKPCLLTGRLAKTPSSWRGGCGAPLGRAGTENTALGTETRWDGGQVTGAGTCWRRARSAIPTGKSQIPTLPRTLLGSVRLR